MRIKPRLKSHHIAFNPERGFGEKIKPKRQRIWRNCVSPQQNYISVHTNFFNQIDIVVRLYFWKGFKGHWMNARSTFFTRFDVISNGKAQFNRQPTPPKTLYTPIGIFFEPRDFLSEKRRHLNNVEAVYKLATFFNPTRVLWVVHSPKIKPQGSNKIRCISKSIG